MESHKNKSKLLSYVLRHKPEEFGLKLEPGGWVDTEKLLVALENRGFCVEILNSIVRTDAKQRYSFSEDGLKIRANQGHSATVNMGFKPKSPPKFLYHGTAEKNIASISIVGICQMNRQHVHLSSDRDTAITVGKRHGKPRLLVVRSEEMHQDGYEFYLSDNGVWLTETVPPQYVMIH